MTPAFVLLAGLICLVIALFTAAKALWTIGLILLVAAFVLWLLGYFNGRRTY